MSVGGGQHVSAAHQAATQQSPSRLSRRRGGRAGGERPMVPEAQFTSYYGRPVVKAAPWTSDIPAYLFFGGLAGASAVLGAGADLTGRPALRRVARLGMLCAGSFSGAALVHDLGRPSRFLNMLRVAKPTSPMSAGTWLIALFSPPAVVAGSAELRHLLPPRLHWLGALLGALDRPAGLAAGATGPGICIYTAVLLADTATPAWREAYRELPFVFTGSAASAAGGLAMLATPLAEARPARRMAIGGSLLELAAGRQMESSMGLAAETLHQGTAGRLMRMNRALTLVGGATALFASRSRAAAVTSGLALLGGSLAGRFGIFHAGQASAKDPKYTVVPQRERLNERASRGTH